MSSKLYLQCRIATPVGLPEVKGRQAKIRMIKILLMAQDFQIGSHKISQLKQNQQFKKDHMAKSKSDLY